MPEYCLIYVTTPNLSSARRIAESLLEKRLVACANIFPIKSIFRWKGKIESAEEFSVILKTRAGLAKDCEREIKKIHPYEIPCIIQIPITEGNPDFLNWVSQETA